MQFHGKKPVRYTDQRVETVRKFILWRLEQLKGLHETGAPAEKREQFKQKLLAIIKGIYMRKDGWTVKSNMPHNMYWDVADYCLFNARYSFSSPAEYQSDVEFILEGHNAFYRSIFTQNFKKFIGRPEGPMQ